MKNTIIKGTGNSRSIKSATTLPESWEAARALLVGDGWPIDLGGLNEAGCQQIGDALNKENLLKDATAILYGKTDTAVVDDILAAIRPLITSAQASADSRCFFVAGQCEGTSAAQKITVDFEPKAILFISSIFWSTNNDFGHLMFAVKPSASAVIFNAKTQTSVSGVSVTWESNAVTIGYGGSGYRYYAVWG